MTTPVRAAPAVTISAVTRDDQMRANHDGITEGGATDAPVSGATSRTATVMGQALQRSLPATAIVAARYRP